MAKILVADDITQNVKLLRVILTSAKYEVIEAYDGEEALNKAKTEAPDLILLDIMMPKITGYEVCQKLREGDATKNLPIIMITALHEMDDRIKGIEAGADDFISKPFNKTELLARVKSLLRARTAVARSEEHGILDAILANVGEGVVVVDGQWEIKNINKVARDLLRIPEAEQKDILAYLSQMEMSMPIDVLANAQEKDTDFQISLSNKQAPLKINARLTKVFDANKKLSSGVLFLRKQFS
ncbi:MAG: response regulator [Candidatus Kuenenia sp.]|nr:response regulator [Candidatus Kuenenia hertensis]